MPATLVWTAARDAVIRERGALSWDALGDRLNVSRGAAIERAKKIGCWTSASGGKGRHLLPPAPGIQREPEPERGALPPGDPIAWAVLLALTPCLGDLAYVPPEPVR